MDDYTEERRRQDLQRLRGLRPIDDDFMRTLFHENIPLVQLVLRIITGKDDLVITSCETQADLKRVTGARSVCLDAYGTDSSGKKYDLEIQRSDKGAEPHRARYHSSVMDVENLDAGQDFSELPDTYTIFITEKDFFGEGRALYHFKSIEEETGRFLNDGRNIIYVNGEYRGDNDLGRLMHDFNCNNAKDMHFELLAEGTRYYKESAKGVDTMCKALEEMTNEAEARGMKKGIAIGESRGIAIGESRGIAIGAFGTLFRLVNKSFLSLGEAAEEAQIPVEQFRQKMLEAGYQL